MGDVFELTADYSTCPAGGEGGQGAWEEVKGLVSVLPKLVPKLVSSGAVCWGGTCLAVRAYALALL
jgi:hypothetical protein